MNNINRWLDKVQQTCKQINLDYIDVIIDQCGIQYSVIPALTDFSPEITWCSLYKGLPEDIYIEEAPLLVRIEFADAQQVQWLYSLAKEASLTAPLLLLGGKWLFEDVSGWLTGCIDALHEGRPGVFRFWDTRLFSHLISDILEQHQSQLLLRPALFWSWMDRDENPVLIVGDGTALNNNNNDVRPKFDLNDSQFEKIMCLSDAKQYLIHYPLIQQRFSSKEKLFSACFKAMLAATAEGLLFDEKREEWVTAWLTDKQL
ncbi:hypothetical protein C7M52_00647 [Mixta theicola]|nr:DUF4123 domain-containing protein [Mixta theicola]QHM74705.1 hypothetical protein C7M52_00647 [Mixta theicola]